MTPNIHPKTGIAYGVMNANNCDPEILSELMFGTDTIDITYLEAMVQHAVNKCQYCQPDQNQDETQFEYLTRVKAEVQALDIDWQEFDDANEEHSPYLCAFNKDNTQGMYFVDSNILMITESPVTAMVSRCSPCYPNAGDLDNKNEDGIEAYNIPESWENEYK